LKEVTIAANIFLATTGHGLARASRRLDGEWSVEFLLPDQAVILMDLHMPGINGIEATCRILHTSPHIGILVLTMFEDDESVFAAMRAGARGYLLKGADQADIARRLMHYFAALSPASLPPFPELTEREREVLTLIAQEWSNAEIAARLVLSAKTVRNHVSNIFNKLQVVDRAQAIIRARDAGLGREG